jgi:hypothetical protein
MNSDIRKKEIISVKMSHPSALKKVEFVVVKMVSSILLRKLVASNNLLHTTLCIEILLL